MTTRSSRARRIVAGLAIATAATFAVAACSTGGSGDSSSAAPTGDPIKVGMILSYTGNFATQATDFENGFLAALDHLTNGTMVVNGHPIEIIKADDTGDPAIGTSKAKELIGEGVQIIAGPTSSAVALAVAAQAIQNNVLYIGGTSGTSDLVGMSDLVFATSGSSPAGSQLIVKIIGDPKGKTVGVIGQDYAYGQSQVTQMKALVEPLGATVVPYLLPQTTTDFVPLTLQLNQTPPDFLTNYWAGAGQDQLSQALGSQGVLSKTTYLGSLLLSQNFKATAEAFGDGIADVTFTIGYFAGATGNEQDKALQAYSAAHGHLIQYDDAVGWNAGEMVNRAVAEGGTDTAAMAKALKDWSFTGPSGEVMIRGEDNQVTVGSFTVHLVKDSSGNWAPELIQAYEAKDLVPPVVRPIP